MEIHPKSCVTCKYFIKLTPENEFNKLIAIARLTEDTYHPALERIPCRCAAKNTGYIFRYLPARCIVAICNYRTREYK